MKRICMILLLTVIALSFSKPRDVQAIVDECYFDPEMCMGGDTSPSVDINDASVVNGTYAAVEWEYDFINGYLNDMVPGYNNVHSATVYDYLPTVTYNGQYYGYYKSQIIRFDPEIYSQVKLILSYYMELVQDEGKDHQDAMAESLINAATAYLPENVSDPINGGANMLYDFFANGNVEGVAQYLVGAVEDKTCDYFEDHVGEFAEDICEVFLQSYSEDMWSVGWVFNEEDIFAAAVQYMQSSFAEHVTDIALDLATGVIIDTLKALPVIGPIVVTFEFIYELLNAINELYLYQYCNEIVENLTEIEQLFVPSVDNWGKNIRIDYLMLNHIEVPRLDENWNPLTPERAREILITSKTFGLLFTHSETDKLYESNFDPRTEQVVCNGTIPASNLYNDCDGSSYSYHTFKATGNIRYITENELYDSIRYASQLRHIDRPMQMNYTDNASRYLRVSTNNEYEESTNNPVSFYVENEYQYQHYEPVDVSYTYITSLGATYFSSPHTTKVVTDSTYRKTYYETTREYHYSYKKYELYDKVCFQKYQNDTSFGGDWNYIDEKIGSVFCRYFDEGSSSDVGKDNNYDRYEYKYGYSYIGDTTLYRYNYPDKYDVRNTDNAYYYKVTSYAGDYFKTVGYTSGSEWAVSNSDGNEGDYYVDYQVTYSDYTAYNGSTVHSYYRYVATGRLDLIVPVLGYVDVPNVTTWAISTPSADSYYRWDPTGNRRVIVVNN
ncbi:hypothetical protein [Candidatus Xianfuyuplasma coldseepsis]|uniref:Uncharacterized protein n=1 Tax=Candidatus Xianfuyuplasma coldseepsis TaxID=2782163 RepID=A0A7L7KTL6_9MOLU|nr:hypothetical protein [Xianfuyuplasma coldseepsis]QMS85128.1 hypothetical protein G4Z02_05005 [Xianfuyuplasma coldseepsis]